MVTTICKDYAVATIVLLLPYLNKFLFFNSGTFVAASVSEWQKTSRPIVCQTVSNTPVSVMYIVSQKFFYFCFFCTVC